MSWLGSQARQARGHLPLMLPRPTLMPWRSSVSLERWGQLHRQSQVTAGILPRPLIYGAGTTTGSKVKRVPSGVLSCRDVLVGWAGRAAALLAENLTLTPEPPSPSPSPQPGCGPKQEEAQGSGQGRGEERPTSHLPLPWRTGQGAARRAPGGGGPRAWRGKGETPAARTQR